MPIAHPGALVDLELPDPTPRRGDLLVRVEAVSVNPVDARIRAGVQPDGPRVLGWDAVGTVEDVGEDATGYAIGDRVWYAGGLNRPGSNAQLQCVDARILSGAPRLTAATVVATAGRDESRTWTTSLGAHHVVDDRQPLKPQLDALGIAAVIHIARLTHTDHCFPHVVELLAPFGRLARIDDPPSLDVTPMKLRSQTLHWEVVFTRALFETPDMAAQGRLLADVAALVDAGALITTHQQTLGVITAENLRRAHALIESDGGVGAARASCPGSRYRGHP